MPASPQDAILVSLVEDDKDIRESLSLLLKRASKLRLLGAYATADQAIREVPKNLPQVMLADIGLPGLSGVECVRVLKAAHPEVQFLMLTVFDDPEHVFESLQAGASGYLLKRTSREQLLQAIVDVASGGAPMTSGIARKVVEFFRKEPVKKPEYQLTSREQQVLQLLAEGALYKQIADQLGLSIDTVRNHIRSIYDKLHVHTRTEAVVKYLGQKPGL